MTKKQKKLVFTLVIFILGIISFAMIFTDLLKKTSENNTEYYYGLDIIFGKSTQIFHLNVNFEFSFMLLLAYGLPLVTSVVMIFLYHKNFNIKYLIFGASFIVSTILIFMTPNFVIYEYEVMSFIKSYSLNAQYNWTLVLSGICSGIAGGICIWMFFNKGFKR